MGQSIISNLNKAFESRIRLGIMSILMVNDEVSFTHLKTLLETSDGNIASHMATLEKHEYVKVIKQFINRKPNTSYAATLKGKDAFSSHLDALEKIISKK